MRKSYKIVISVILFMPMCLCIAIRFTGIDMGEIFCSCSAGYLVEVATGDRTIELVLLLVCIVAWLLYMRNLKMKSGGLFAFVFIIWILNGRAVGFKVDEYVSVRANWFFLFETSEFNACADLKTDCETIVSYQTTVEELSFWRVRIKNKNVNQVIFVGPMIWNKTIPMLKKEFGSGLYNK